MKRRNHPASTALSLLTGAAVLWPTLSFAAVDELMKDSLQGLLNRQVSVASKRQEDLFEAPGIVRLVTSEEIDRMGADNLIDILSRLPNIHLLPSPTFRDNMISIRSQSTTDMDTHTLILLNGRPMRETAVGGWNGAIYKNFPIDVIDHIEVISGPGSVLYGTAAFAGVVNIVTKTPIKPREVTLNGGYGTNATHLETLTASVHEKGFAGTVSLRGSGTSGWPYRFTDETGTRSAVDMEQNGESAFAQANYGGVSMQFFRGSDRDTTLAPKIIWPASVLKEQRTFFDLGYQLPINDAWKASFNITYNGVDGAFPEAGSSSSSDDIFYEASLSGKVTDRINVVMGAAYDKHHGSLKATGGPFQTDWQSAYIQADGRVNDYIKLIGGMQVSKLPGFDPSISPRVGTIVNFTPNFGMKLLYSEAYKGPDAAETTLNIPFTLVANPNTKPELIATYDAQLFYRTSEFFVALTGYHSKGTDLITTRFLGIPGQSARGIFNDGEIEYQGVELEGKFQLPRGFELSGSVSHQTAESALIGTDNDAGYGPNFMAKAGLSYDSGKGVTVGIFNQYYGEAANTAATTTSPNYLAANPPAKGYNWLTAKVSVNVNHFIQNKSLPETDVYLYGENLLNEDVYFPEYLRQQVNTFPTASGRTVFGGVRVRF